ncbi:MAG TPA: M6 family metalloprotease domain-containing protein [bacterium]|jgi:immune inhibitor A
MKCLYTATILALLFCGILSVLAMPPHPDLMKRIESGAIPTPYYLQNETALRAAGVDAPRTAAAFLNRTGRHPLDENLNILVLLLDFSTKGHQAAPSAFDNLLFGGQTGSLNNFMSETTYGNVTIVTLNMPSAVGWLRAPQTYAYYVNGQNGFGAYPHNAQRMVEDAVALADPFVDFSPYDNDGDGYVDALFVIHSGPGAEFTGSSNDVWSHAWSVSTPQTVDGVQVWGYSSEPEYWQANGDMTCGVYAHEMGHAAFGLPDLYDTGNDSQGIGRWSLMASGSWNGNLGNSPAHFDAWSKLRIGVVTPTPVSSTMIGASIPAVENDPTVYRMNISAQQYMLVENRQPAGYDASLPGSGLIIYHVDDAAGNNNAQWYPGHTTSGHYRVAVEQADGLWELEHNINRGNSGDPFPGSTNKRTFDDASTPNSRDYAGTSTGFSVRNISNSGAVMTADLYPVPARTITLTTPNGGETWYSGDADTIRWTAGNLTGNIKIEVNYAYPSYAWNVITSGTPNVGWYRWVVGPGISANARIRVTSVSYSLVGDTSAANFATDQRSVWISNPATNAVWLTGDVDTITWTSANFSENLRIEVNRAYPTGSWTTVAASVPNGGAYVWTVTGPAGASSRLRIRGVTHPASCDTSSAFSIGVRSITVTSPNTALTWVMGDSTYVRWTSANMSENVKIELKRMYPTGVWETLAASVPNSGQCIVVPTGTLSTTARLRITGVTHPSVGDTSNVNFILGQRSIHVTLPNTAGTCLIGGVDTVKWTTTCMTNEPVAIQFNYDYPNGPWNVLNANAANTGRYPWLVSGPVTPNMRVRILAAAHPAIGDTSDADIALAVPSLALTSPAGGETWYVGDADTIRWISQNLTENVKLEINRTYPAGAWTTLASSVANTGWYRWVVTTGDAAAARMRISAVAHTFVKDTSNAFAIAARSITLISPNTAVTWLTGDTATIQWSCTNLPDDSVRIEINRAYSSGSWVALATRVPNNGSYRWVVTGPTTTTARIRISGAVHTNTSKFSAANFTIGTRRLTVTAPNTAVTWSTGTLYSITWTSTYMTDSVKIELNRAYPSGAWETIAARVPNNGLYRWTAGGAASTTARMRVSATARTGIGDTSNVNFIIRIVGAPPRFLDVTDGSQVPTEFGLAQNYPNPFNATTEITFDLPVTCRVELKVFDMLGHEVTTLTDQMQPAGRFRVMWDGLTARGALAATGTYLYRMRAGDYVVTKKMILLK